MGQHHIMFADSVYALHWLTQQQKSQHCLLLCSKTHHPSAIKPGSWCEAVSPRLWCGASETMPTSA